MLLPIVAQTDQKKEKLKMTFEPEWQFIERSEYEPFLQRISTEVAKLLANNMLNRERFKQYSDRFHKEWMAYIEAEQQLQKKIDDYRRRSSECERLRDKKAGPLETDYVWYDDSPFSTGDPNHGFWIPPCEKPIDPTLRLVTGPGGIPPRNNKEQLEQSYIWLIIIHDWMFPDRVPIDENKHPDSLSKLNYIIGMNLAEKGRCIIEMALEDVKADLGEKPTETEQKAATSPCRRIWTCIKRIPRWIYILVIFLAALFTVFHYLGWI